MFWTPSMVLGQQYKPRHRAFMELSFNWGQIVADRYIAKCIVVTVLCPMEQTMTEKGRGSTRDGEGGCHFL